MESTLHNISDPSSERYGKHLTRGEAKALLRPSRESVEFVKRWLAHSGLSENRQDMNHDPMMEARLDATVSRKLLSRHLDLDAPNGRARTTISSTLPNELRQHATIIQLHHFEHASLPPSPIAKKRMVQKNIIAEVNDDDQQVDSGFNACNKGNTPTCIRKLYRMGNKYAKPHPKSLLGVVGFNTQTAQHDQLDKFLNMFADYAIGSNFSTESINGGQNPQGEYPSGEANLDIQYAIAMSYRIPVRYYPTGGEKHDFIPDLDISDPAQEYMEPWLQFASYLLELDDDDLPQVLSLSYGVNEQAVPKAYAKQVCNVFGQLGARGVSIIAASGDTGPGVSCRSNDGTNTTKFLPMFPAACPYVTSVGGTQNNGPEVAVDFSSGGFSEYWTRPAWQEEAVGSYLRTYGRKWKGYYNRDGRAFPDVAAQGKAFYIFNHDKIEAADGTSASAPVFASMIALLNDMRFEKGKSPMGFLNPWLYSIGSDAFTDIAEGKSRGCQGTSYSGAPAPKVQGAGWDAVPGWDPVTGRGTPRFDRLKSLASR
ncbi:hypothetical protein RJ55_03706 [Drechmeria coniospora]|nr:hypothetical protein RJ55_03706 [Drechmeria coniospora]